MANPGDIAACWDIKLADGPHKVLLEHGTTSGKRVIFVDGVEVLRRNWLFRLVGSESFKIGKRAAEIEIISGNLTSFEYVLKIDGKTLKKFIESQVKNTRAWLPNVSGAAHRVVLDIETMDVYVDGEKSDTFGEFTESGVETHFTMSGFSVHISSLSSGNKRKGLLYHLHVDGTKLEPVNDLQ
uniref:Fas apoptotic inhibitory related molecule n=1 Tax=Suberites domuncula TaxID=55567 RepID=Q5TJD9_SUBDO|nr:fas apoptotic inhibitory related molecule [Suberites domuncula]